ncbi:hypothetical protein [Aeromonas veronii]|uniref:hypothetical protein n=1 Tax=Aeromonas veronii TaxID=654 RepID=UPI003BA0862D
MEEAWVNDAYQKSKLTVYLETLQELFEQQEPNNQYKLTAQVLDALHDTSFANEFPQDITLAKAALSKFKCSCLKDYVAQYCEQINPMYCSVGDVVIVLDDLHDDIAFNVGSHFMFVHDEDTTIQITQLAFTDIPEGAVAFRFA